MEPIINSSSEEEISFRKEGSQAGTIVFKPSNLSQVTFQPRTINLKEGTEILIQRHDEGDKTDKTQSNLLFTCPVLSGTHGKLKYSQGNFFVLDNNSTNGSFLTRPNCDQFKLEAEKSYILNSGDILQLGYTLEDALDGLKKPCLKAEINISENKTDTNCLNSKCAETKGYPLKADLEVLQGKIDTTSDVPNQEENPTIDVASVNKSPSVEKFQNIEKPGILKKFHCQDCTKSFRRQDVLELHSKKHMNKEDIEKNNLHWASKMKGIRQKPTSPFYKDLMNKTKALTCKVCSKMFMTTGLLYYHIQLEAHIQPPDKKENESDNGSNQESDKAHASYKCNDCKEVYSNEKDLDTHVTLNHAEIEQVEEDPPQNHDSPKAPCGKILKIFCPPKLIFEGARFHYKKT